MASIINNEDSYNMSSSNGCSQQHSSSEHSKNLDQLKTVMNDLTLLSNTPNPLKESVQENAHQIIYNREQFEEMQQNLKQTIRGM